MFRESQVIGPYTLIHKLGRGGFGEVWLAEKRAKFVTTKVAVKLPLDEQVDHEAIRQEAVLWEQASGHPNILPIIDADEYDGQVVIVSEYAPDGSLEQFLKTHGKMSVEKAVETTIQILNGLEFLHSRNIIHRDLKPANILLQGKTPRLADFGISRALRTTMASQSQHISGTFAYMSPEALDGRRSVQTDIWSVGVNLYQFLTGKLPFPQNETSALITSIMMRDYEPLPEFVPPEVKEIIAKSLSKSPENRYKTAGEMREDLQRFISGNSSALNMQHQPTRIALNQTVTPTQPAKPNFAVSIPNDNPSVATIVTPQIVQTTELPRNQANESKFTSGEFKDKSLFNNSRRLFIGLLIIPLFIIIGAVGIIVWSNFGQVETTKVTNTNTIKTDSNSAKNVDAAPDINEILNDMNHTTINFAAGSADIPPDAKPLLEKFAEQLKKFPRYIIRIGVHTDNVGNAFANEKISQLRANSIRKFLINLGVSTDMLIAKGYGGDQPKYPNDTDEHKFQNRRIEYSLLP